MMRIDHIGYAVKNIDKAKKAMEILGFVFDEVVRDNDRNVFISFGQLGNYRVELIAPSSEGSPVDTLLSKMGPTPYHLCYKSRNMEADIKTLQTQGFKVSVPLAPAIAFGNRRVVFMYSLPLGLIEIVEE